MWNLIPFQIQDFCENVENLFGLKLVHLLINLLLGYRGRIRSLLSGSSQKNRIRLEPDPQHRYTVRCMYHMQIAVMCTDTDTEKVHFYRCIKDGWLKRRFFKETAIKNINIKNKLLPVQFKLIWKKQFFFPYPTDLFFKYLR